MSTKTEEKPMITVKKHVQALGTAAAVIADPLLGNQLITKFAEMYELPINEAQRFYNREKDSFGKLISQSPALQQCTPMSAYLAFGFVMKYKATFDTGRGALAYLIPGRRNTGTKDNPNYIWEMLASLTAEGEKEARVSTGILKKVGHPVIVHEGDTYKKFMDDETGQIVVQFAEAENPSDKIRGSFIRIVEPDGTVVFKTFNLVDVKTWQDASTKKNYGKTNPLYTSGVDGQIQESFFKTKTLLHSFKGYKTIDYGGSREGFIPDVDAAKSINPNYTDEEFTNYENVPAAQIQAPADEFTQAVNEEEPEKESVTVLVPEDDDPFK